MTTERAEAWLRAGGMLREWRPDMPEIADRASWIALEERTRAVLRQEGERSLNFEWPPLPASGWLAYTRTGNRTDHESRYFARRRALVSLVLAECAEDSGRFLDAIVNGLWAICEETGWQLPAHNGYVRDAASLPLPIAGRPVLDLFACETGALLAVTLRLLGPRLDAVTPMIGERVRGELDARIATPFLTQHFWWMGNGDEPMCNWTPWCVQNTLLVFFAVPQPDDRRRAAVLQSARALDCFLKDYGEDGCCDEGAQYYRHAALCLCGALRVLDGVCTIPAVSSPQTPVPSAFSALWREPKIRAIAGYILNVHVSDRHYVNFADCSPIAGRAGAREYRFAQLAELPELASFAAIDGLRAGRPYPEDAINLHDALIGLAAWPEMGQEVLRFEASGRTEADLHPKRVWYPSVGLFIARDAHWCLAVKAGDNDDNHNHNDTGSVTLYLDGQPLLVDAGVESYTRRTFSPDRYGIWTMQSSWHNLPEFDGIMQFAGAAAQAGDVRISSLDGGNAADEASIEMDLSRAWPPEARLRRCTRRVSLVDGVVTLEDDAEGDFESAVLNLMFCQKPCAVLKDGTLELTAGTSGTLRFFGATEVRLEERPVADPRLATAWPGSLWRARIAFNRKIRMTAQL